MLIKEIGFHDISPIGIAAEMLVGQFGDHTTTRRALDEAFHNEEGLVDLFNGACILADGSGDSGDTHRTALELVDDGEQNLVVNLVEAILVDVQGREGNLRDLCINLAITLHLSEITHAAQESIGDTRRSSRANWPNAR